MRKDGTYSEKWGGVTRGWVQPDRDLFFTGGRAYLGKKCTNPAKNLRCGLFCYRIVSLITDKFATVFRDRVSRAGVLCV